MDFLFNLLYIKLIAIYNLQFPFLLSARPPDAILWTASWESKEAAMK